MWKSFANLFIYSFFLIMLSFASRSFITSPNRKIIKLLPYCSLHPYIFSFKSWPSAPAITCSTSFFNTVLFLGDFCWGQPLFLASLYSWNQIIIDWHTKHIRKMLASHHLGLGLLDFILMGIEIRSNRGLLFYWHYFARNIVLISFYCSPSVSPFFKRIHHISNSKDCYYGAWNENQMDVWNRGNYRCGGCSTKCRPVLQQAWQNANV